jgi:serine/threonine-protein kinase
MIGRTVSHFRVTGKLGAGGMGEVYRAEDMRLGRQVALKVLPEAFLADPERLSRFQREARALAAVRHPGIAHVHGLEEVDGRQLLVMELVEGETLAERLERGPLPVDEVLAVGIRLAEALQAAHDRGIVHRDLKPANVKVSPEGEVKILDFGLAKAMAPEPAPSGDLSQSPTLAYDGTVIGMLLGTAPYMSPEQARGKAVDARTDVWAFGCVLYEMLAGRRAFPGETVTDVLAAVVARDPDWDALPAGRDPRLLQLLRRCLAKEPRRRLHSVADARLELEALRDEPAAAPTLIAGGGAWRPSRRPSLLAGSIMALAAAVIATLLTWHVVGLRAAPAPLRRVGLVTPPGLPFTPLGRSPSLAIAPDASRVVYTSVEGSLSRLLMRSLDAFRPQPIGGTEDGAGPVFSPDGRFIAYFTTDQLKKIPVEGGAPVSLCPAREGRGAWWADDGTIIFATHPSEGLYRVPATGGTPRLVTHLDEKAGELSHRLPQLLPGGRAVLTTVLSRPGWSTSVVAIELPSGKRHPLVPSASHGRFVPPAQLVFARGDSIFGVGFDPQRLELRGEPVPLVEGVEKDALFETMEYDVAGDGTLVYAPTVEQTGVVAVLEGGRRRDLPLPARRWVEAALDPQAKRLALVESSREGAWGHIWIDDLGSGGLLRLTREGGDSVVWSPDGKRLAYRNAVSAIASRNADGTGEEEVLLPMPASDWDVQLPTAYSPDGRQVILMRRGVGKGWDLLVSTVAPSGRLEAPRPLAGGKGDQVVATFSPDGRWVAFASDESGQPEVYVQPFPGPGGRQQLSQGGGYAPFWGADGQLYFLSRSRLMAVPVTTTGGFFGVATPRVVYEPVPQVVNGLAVAPDGRAFLLEGRFPDQQELRVVFGFAAEARRLLGAGAR